MRCGTGTWLLLLTWGLWGAPGLAAGSGDEWFGPDKPKHFGATLGLAGLGYGAGALLFESPRARWLSGAGLGLGVGLGKEFYDLGRGGRFSSKDLVWDAVGTATGLGLAWLIDALLNREPSAAPQARALSDGKGKLGACELRLKGPGLTDMLVTCHAVGQVLPETYR
ncbi:hypothetical protein POL68_39200 [Stigmatella sp. ncwal1]|uniref:Lipoprotein n=1 Tax=Stigmatella ashevillensis TaxID=2995309 RepID=A0ABT5DQ97_9BACT|nr:hypothetical protein [Stigmatella ashevillena]MDC0714541.1 hypothetical protein [Stigmatella ashevillena]